MAPYERHSAVVNGQKISYLERGTNGTPLLFLHGWGGSAESFLPLWDSLSAHEEFAQRRMIAIDFPGFGESPAPEEPWDVPRYALCVAQYLSAMGVSIADLVNHSFGGRVTTVLLSEYATSFGRAFYLAPAGIRHEKKGVENAAGVMKKFFGLPGMRILFPTIRKIGYRLIGGRDYLETSGVMKETFQLVTQEDLSDRLPKITHPVAIAFGKNDTYVPYTDGALMQQAIPGAQLTVFEDGRHGIHKTHAKQLTPLFIKFFTS